MSTPLRRASRRAIVTLVVLALVVTATASVGAVLPSALIGGAAQSCSGGGSNSGGAACLQAGAAVTLTFTPPGSAQLGADVEVQVQTSNPDLTVVKVALGCGSPATFELNAPSAAFTWHTSGCPASHQRYQALARTGSDGDWSHAVASAAVLYTLTPWACPLGQFRAEYYDDPTSLGDAALFLQQDPVFITCETVVDHTWGMASPAPGITSATYMVQWNGVFSFAAQDYTFTATADDGLRLWVDDDLVVDAWKDQAVTTYTASRRLTAGQHAVRIEYYQRFCCNAVARVSW